MASDESIFVTKRGISTTVTIADDEMLKARFIGDVRIDLDGRSISMTDVLCVPRLDTNLLSISALTRMGLKISFEKSGVKITRGSTLVATGIAKGRTYFLRSADTAFYTTEGRDMPQILILWEKKLLMFQRDQKNQKNSAGIQSKARCLSAMA